MKAKMEKLALEDLIKLMETKTEMLRFTHDETPRLLEEKHLSSMERQRKTLETKVEEVHDIKVRMQELKIQQGEKGDEIRDWSVKIEHNMAVFEQAITNLGKAVKQVKQDLLKETRDEEEKIA